MRHWLFKSEPDCYSFTDLENAPGQTTSWDGVRNYQARNFMRDDMKKGDLGFFYHSGKNPEIAGIVEIVREGHPDITAQDPEAGHFDPKATPGDPRWYMVDVKLVRRFEPPVPRSLLRFVPELAGMELMKVHRTFPCKILCPFSPPQYHTAFRTRHRPRLPIQPGTGRHRQAATASSAMGSLRLCGVPPS